MATRMQQRKGTAAQWISTNGGDGPVLNAGEIGYEIDTNKFKIGDGISHWVDLNYFLDAEALGGNIDDYIPLTQKGAALGVATLNADGVIPSDQIPSLVGLDTEITAAVDAAINSLIDGAPAALNTLNELAAAVNDDASFASSVTTALNAKAPTANPIFTGTVQGVTKTHVGLGNVDNTSDADKPVSTAVAAELADKLDVSEAAASAVESVYNKLDGGTGIDITQDPTSKMITVAVDSTVATETYADDAAGDAVDAHNLVTTNVHGIDDTAELVTLTDTQELTNKTLASPTITVEYTTSYAITNQASINNFFSTTNTYPVTIDPSTGSLTNPEFSGSEFTGYYTRSFATWSATWPELLNYVSVPTSATATISPTELRYIDGLTTNINGKFSNIDTALGTKANSADIEELAQDAVGGSIGTGLSYDTVTNVLSVDNTAIQARVANVSDTEIGYLNGVTSAIQDQLDDKAPLADPTFTGTATTNNLVVDGDFTVNGTNFSASATSITIEDNLVQLAHQNAANTVDLGLVVGYNDGTAKHAGIARDVSDDKWKLFKGVTSEPTTTVDFGSGSLDALAVGAFEATSATVGSDTVATLTASQTITNKTLTAPKIVSSINAQTASYTTVLADASKFIEMGVSSGNTLTVPANSSVEYPIGTTLHVIQTGTGQTTLTPAGGVTINGTPGLKLRAQWSAVTLVKRATDTWVAFGDLTA